MIDMSYTYTHTYMHIYIYYIRAGHGNWDLTHLESGPCFLGAPALFSVAGSAPVLCPWHLLASSWCIHVMATFWGKCYVLNIITWYHMKISWGTYTRHVSPIYQALIEHAQKIANINIIPIPWTLFSCLGTFSHQSDCDCSFQLGQTYWVP